MTATSVGSLIEFYDFFLASAAAATVWPRIFFPARMDPSLALATSVASVGLAYIVRPVGAIVFGHVADKYGRRSTLVGNLLLMGIASVGTGLIPSYVSWGIFSVIMLYVFRLEIRRSIGDQRGISEALQNLGVIIQHADDFHDANRLYDESLNIRRRIGDKLGIATTLAQFGRLAEEQKNLQLAESRYQEACQILEMVRAKAFLEQVRKDLELVQHRRRK
jgi:tetratricopeptide (TPR) repeat protein